MSTEDHWKTIARILSLLSPKEKDLVNRLRKELLQVKKGGLDKLDGLDSQKNNMDSLETQNSTVNATGVATNLYGESKNEELDETASMAGGSVAGSASGAWADGPLLKKEEEKKSDDDLMEYVEKLFNENKLFNAFYLREKIKQTLNEDSNKLIKVSKLTGMNKLRRFLEQNIKSIKNAYMDLTTDKAQRASFKAHLLKLLSELFQNLFINTESINPETGEVPQKSNINFEIDNHNGEDGTIVDVDGDGKPDTNKFETIPGMDETGKKDAVVVYNKLESQITEIFSTLSNDLDRKVFAKWMLKNLSEHMDKWESLFQKISDQNLDDESLSTSDNSELAA